MKTWEQFSEAKDHNFKKDSSGGIIPQKMDLAKKGDLITLPEGIKGTNCSNCRWIKKEGEIGMCNHPEIKQYVNERNCCAYWDNDEVKRPWEKKK